jgi:hypothetical protein
MKVYPPLQKANRPQRGSNVPREVCSNDSWIADHDFGYQIGYGGYSDFFDFLTKVALNVWDDEEEIEQKDEGEA